MILIAHRGNYRGKNISRENHPDYIQEAIKKGYDVELDVWNIDGSYYLGHDEPHILIKNNFIENKKMWCHAKNIQALHSMLTTSNVHCFWHEDDKVTLTSKGFIWKYPEVYLKGKLTGICSDWL